MPAENNGLGWILTLTDTLMHEYGWLIDYTLWQVRLPVAFALYAAIAARYGNKAAGPTYLDREILEALQQARQPAQA